MSAHPPIIPASRFFFVRATKHKQLETFLAQYKISGPSSSEAPQVPDVWRHVVAPRGVVMRDMWCKLYACFGPGEPRKVRNADVRLVRKWGDSELESAEKASRVCEWGESELESAEKACRVLAGIRHTAAADAAVAAAAAFDPASERLNIGALSYDSFFGDFSAPNPH